MRRFFQQVIMKRILVAFDFDHTIVDDNTDIYVQRLAPNDGQLPDEIKRLYSDRGWIEFMTAVFKYLHVNGTTGSQLLECITEIPLVNGMLELMNFLTMEQQIEGTEVNVAFDAVIVSDANSVFINHILRHTGIDRTFSAVYTNPASFNADGCLTLQPFHFQDWCTLSSVNMCKGHILDQHRFGGSDDQVAQYDMVAYVGDGNNDFCPALRLKSSDIVFARRGYSLAKRISNAESEKLLAKTVIWDTGFDILNALKNELTRLL